MYLTAAYETTGLSATITIYNLADNSVVVNGAAMSEIGTSGVYKYNFTAYDGSLDYLYRSDGGAALGDYRYKFWVKLNTTQWVMGVYETTGLSPTVTITDLLDNSTAINSAAMSEIGTIGVYKYEFSAYSANKDYLYTADGGAGLGDERYRYGHNVRELNTTSGSPPPTSAYTRYPHTATIGWHSAGTVNTLGVFSNGALNTIWGYCNIQRSNKSRFSTGAGGDAIHPQFDIFWHRRLNTTFSLTQDVVIEFNASTHQVLDIIGYRKHTEITV